MREGAITGERLVHRNRVAGRCGARARRPAEPGRRRGAGRGAGTRDDGVGAVEAEEAIRRRRGGWVGGDGIGPLPDLECGGGSGCGRGEWGGKWGDG